MQVKMQVDKFPDALDPVFYRSIYEDVRKMSDDQVRSHFVDYGITEGRIGCAPSLRENFVELISPNLRIIEFGPFCFPSLRGENVRYFDVASKDELISRAIRENIPFESAPNIDYVSHSANADVITEVFDVVFSSHCIEHQPDLIRHLNDVERILENGGKYFIVIPDMRYCFDHYLAASNIFDVLGARLDGMKRHFSKNVLEHYLYTTHNDSDRHWRGDHGRENEKSENLIFVKENFENIERQNDVYIDAHAWHFTPIVFENIITMLNSLGMIGLKIDRIYQTPYGRCEFCAILSK
jgi:SAM-dependent methyltransferase